MARRAGRLAGLGLALAACPVALAAQSATGDGVGNGAASGGRPPTSAEAQSVQEVPRPEPRPVAPLYPAPPIGSSGAQEAEQPTPEPPIPTPTISEPSSEAPAAASPDERETPAILIIDRDRVLSESAPAKTLAARELRAQRRRWEALEALRADLETEEAEIAALRETAPSSVFEQRVRVFDERVREARRSSQAKGEALQRSFAEARRGLAEALQPVLLDILKETGAAMIVDAGDVLAARAGADLTEEAIRRFNALAERNPPAALELNGGASPAQPQTGAGRAPDETDEGG